MTPLHARIISRAANYVKPCRRVSSRPDIGIKEMPCERLSAKRAEHARILRPYPAYALLFAQAATQPGCFLQRHTADAK